MEIIRRKSEVSKESISTKVGNSTKTMQLSYNSFGHLVLRFFDPNAEGEDILITLDREETQDIFMFMHSIGH